MRQIRNAARELELRGSTIFFILFLALSVVACLYYAVMELLSEL